MTTGRGNYLKYVGRSLDLFQRWLRFTVKASPINLRRVPILDAAMFRGRSVVVIGPASTVLEDLQGLDVDGFDYVVRMNNGIPLALEDPENLGTRTDILFHNLNETGERNAGAIPDELLRMHMVRYCVFPHWTFRGSKTRLYEKRREASSTTEFVVPPARFCSRLRRRLAGHKPTTGASALLFFLQCDLKVLQIHGFTFFQTPYAAGYNDAVKTDEDAASWIAASNIHDPEREKTALREDIDKARRRGMIVKLGQHVEKHLGAWASPIAGDLSQPGA